MILGIANSLNDYPIRLTDERLEHIIEEHPKDFSFSDEELLLETIEDPEYILRQQGGARAAVVNHGKRFLHVMYLEYTNRKRRRRDGFIITAYYLDDFDRSLVIWDKYGNVKKRK